MQVAILDDYARVALDAADWSQLPAGSKIAVFDRHLSEAEAAIELAPFEVLCTMRERMALPGTLIERLPRLKLIVVYGPMLANLDLAAARARGVAVVRAVPPESAGAPRDLSGSTAELAWGLLIATARHIAEEDRRLKQGGWQASLGINLEGRTLGILGLGNVGRRMARYARAFGMEVIAWSQNLTAETAQAAGARRVEKDELFRLADILSLHVVLSARTRGLVGARELGLMKPQAFLINTARGPIVDEAALIAALRQGRLAGAGLDVFDQEPLPAEHPLRSLANVTLTPHLGYVTGETLAAFYSGMPAAIAAFAAGAARNLADPAAGER